MIDWSSLEPKTIIPGFHGRFAHSSRMTFVLWEIEAGAILPAHSHPHEQVAHVLEGTFEITIDGQTETLSAGQIGVVPPDRVHSGRALTACRIMDAFAPVREDYMANAGLKPVLALALEG